MIAIQRVTNSANGSQPAAAPTGSAFRNCLKVLSPLSATAVCVLMCAGAVHFACTTNCCVETNVTEIPYVLMHVVI